MAPRNLVVTSPYLLGAIDVRWDNPNLIPQNSGLQILGCNVYRATDAQFGPYVKITDTPVTVLFYRDQTQEQLITEEDATPTLQYSLEPDCQWRIWAQHKPIIVPGKNGQISNRVEDVLVEIDDGDGVFRTMPAYKINGQTGKIDLISWPIWNHEMQQAIPPRLPRPPQGRVKIAYRYMKHSVITNLNQRIFYKVTTVAVDPKDPQAVIETPIDEVSDRSAFDIEHEDYIWREAMNRNRWILEQAGERVKVFVRKWMGSVCPNHQNNYGQGYQDCSECYGSNIVGGFSGPYDIIIAPPETERSVELADMGLHIRYDWATWTGAYPLLNPRDIIVRQNNERYMVGPVNYQGARGATFQQHFTMSIIDHGDIRYQIPIDGGQDGVPASFDQYREPRPTDAAPVIPDKPEIPKDRLIKGRTVTFENISFVLALSFLGINTIMEYCCGTGLEIIRGIVNF